MRRSQRRGDEKKRRKKMRGDENKWMGGDALLILNHAQYVRHLVK